MPLWKQALLRRYHEQADPDPGAAGGGGGGADPEPKPADPTPEPKKGPSDEEARLLKENMKRKEKEAELTKELNTAKSVLSQLEELGGLDALKSIVNERKTAEEKKLEEKGEWDRLKQSMATEHQKAVDALKAQQTELSQANQALLGQINELTIGSAFSNSAFISTETTITPSKARIIYGEHFELVDGKVVGYDKPRSAKDRTPLVDSRGEPVGFEEAMKKIVEADPEKDHVLRSKAKPGAGSATKPVQGAKTEAAASSQDKIKGGLASLGIVLNQ
jgi:hypothetical protein